jgi:hypothetical protein
MTLDDVFMKQLTSNSSSPHRCVTQILGNKPAVHVDHVHHDRHCCVKAQPLG